MPKNKAYEDRKKIMNELFRTRFYSFEEIKERVESFLGTTVHDKTIHNTIRDMRNEGAPIIFVKGKGYMYDPKGFNLYEVRIHPDAINKIKLAAAIIKQIPGLEIYDEIKEAFEKLEMRTEETVEDEHFIQFDTRPEYKGSKYLSEIIEAVKGETVISFDYQSFKDDKPFRAVVHPYLLKEWNNRWFLIGLPDKSRIEKKAPFFQYGLERIVGKIKPEIKIEFSKHIDFNPKTHFQNVIGVSIPENSAVEKIVLKVSARRAKYIATNSLHPTQTLFKETKTHKTFVYKLIVNPELVSLILSFGQDMEVMEPKELRYTIAGILTESRKQYL